MTRSAPDARRRRRDVHLGDLVRQADVRQHVAGEEEDVLLDVADERAQLGDAECSRMSTPSTRISPRCGS